MTFELLLITALLADCIIGDPKWFPHPVRIIGWFCIFLETHSRKYIQNEKNAGIVTSCAVLILCGGGVALLLYLLGLLSETLQICVAIFIIYTFMAIKDLLVHSKNVYKCLYPEENLKNARIAVGYIVGRDTSDLDKAGICRACVETVGENMVDGITSPLFWAIIFSFFALLIPSNAIIFAAIGIAIYKAVNTMDSMFGYKNEKYYNFGWFPARLDDIVNLIPARISGFCIVIGSFFYGTNWRKSLEIFLRDRLSHNSPNAGHPEAALAGALEIQLGGSSFYFGKEIRKPTIGDNTNEISPHHILKTHHIVLISSLVFLVIALLIRKVTISCLMY